MPRKGAQENLVVDAAMRRPVEVALRSSGIQLTGGRWLAPRNVYLGDAVGITDKADGQRYGQLVKYISASAPLHAIDGARFLGRALYCQSINDVHSARHFAYYAELRSVMSILASEGLGVFNKFHYAVFGISRAARSTNVPTHKYVWKALHEWSNSPRAVSLVSRIVKMNGKRLDEIIGDAFVNPVLQPIASEWFRTWGIDLSVLAEEQSRRNASSYRPSALLAKSSQNPVDVVNQLTAFWDAFEPTSAGSFGNIDRNLVRLAFEHQARSLGISRSSVRYRELARGVASSISRSTAEGDLLLSFMLRSIPAFERDLQILLAARPSATKNRADQGGMIARAAILLRIALGSASLLVNDSGMPVEAFSEWLRTFAIDAALVEPDFNLKDIGIIWEEIHRSLDELSAAKANLTSFLELVATLPREIISLTQCEKIAIATFVA